MFNRNEFSEQYLTELYETLNILDSNFISLIDDPENDEILESILRDLHKVKGSARMMKYTTIEKISHSLESVFKGISEQRYPFNDDMIKLAFAGTDLFRLAAKKITETGNEEINSKIFLEECDRAAQGEAFSLHGLVPVDPNSRGKSQDGSRTEMEMGTSHVKNQHMFESIRVKLDTVNGLASDVNNLIIKQFQLKKDYEMIDHLEEMLLQMISLSGSEKAQDILQLHNLKTELLRETQKYKSTVQDRIISIETETFKLQENIFSLRMLPLQQILTGLDRMVEEAALSLGKKIRLNINGSDIRLDKAILERINDPIIHLVRNSIDHGIETPEERVKSGKKEDGHISINCEAESGVIIIRVSDDGAGIRFEKIREKAMINHPTKRGEIQKMSDQELVYYLFESGFTTREDITDFSGRGVGLDIVKHNVEQVKGKITINSTSEKGTEFVLNLPLSLATVDGFFIVAVGNKYFIPSNFIKSIHNYSEMEIVETFGRNKIRYFNELIPLYTLAPILGGEEKGNFSTKKIIIAESLGVSVGIIVDQIIEFTSLIFRPLPAGLQRMKTLQGVVFDENFSIISMLHLPAIVDRMRQVRDIDTKKRYHKEKSDFVNILIVDDSPNTREIEKSILEMAGYHVITAEHGVEGLARLNEYDIHLIITDIQMPQMDGFTFIENLRRYPKYNSTPVIVVSSFENPDHLEQAKTIGANSFIVKSNFNRNNLLQAVTDQLN